ncbi:response regulator transcription factor [Bradyrhizobium elkanii]|uniref:response regulator transcription factor n=1 Tax=Bradyrhizobium elkanii TaxID=29448 RepID=UPI00216821D0|nr:response regulator [Bradyrhizobium elkanii]MCS3522198.1 FixJ family two-component response regulator [Bradyrhizobium elkanii]MCS4069852.1 FixJ family two-component response regulator [Bradyrhizobium elkanii]MCS4076483.1 FixJ family two-component response regulator [Bradyrhizobium elkanii]MCW2124959.1 FixJ family two-component response regulator [Bradyrhizobium elkanii]MCW2171705.1 FixJ family two-component response regulator [Bradyrhizobium elkanii]
MIAIIDDDESVRSALATLLTSFGYRPLTYDSASYFLDSGLAASCSCVISDIAMPGMNGFELMRQLRLTGCEIPVILITARNGPTIVAQAQASGAHSLFKKPFEPKQLVEALNEALVTKLGNAFGTDEPDQ